MNRVSAARVIGISISISPNLAELGYGEEHLHELMIAIARASLRLGTEDHPIHLAYGGDLRPGGFTETLFDLARAETRGDWHCRLYSYLAWPHYLDLTKGNEGERLNICDFVRITPADAGFGEYPDDTSPKQLPEARANLLAARCISRLREVMTAGGRKRIDGEPAPALAARVILGGKTTGYAGIMPGLFEEFMLAQEAGIPIYVIGGFGGAAEALTEALIGQSPDLPPTFTLDYQREHTAALAALEESYLADGQLEQPSARYGRLAQAVAAARAGLEHDGVSTNGLNKTQNERLMRSQDITEITGLMQQGLWQVWDA